MCDAGGKRHMIRKAYLPFWTRHRPTNTKHKGERKWEKRTWRWIAMARRIQLSFFTFSVKLIPKWENCEANRRIISKKNQNGTADYYHYYYFYYYADNRPISSKTAKRRVYRKKGGGGATRTELILQNVYFIIKYLQFRDENGGKWWVCGVRKLCAPN